MTQTRPDHLPTPSVLVVLALVIVALFLVLKAAFTAISLVMTLAVLAGVVFLLRHDLRKRRL